jgi:hypothetical protein
MLGLAGLNSCSEWETSCGPDESFAGGDTEKSACVILVTCFTDADCPAPYDCIDIADLDATAAGIIGGTAAICGRFVPSRE